MAQLQGQETIQSLKSSYHILLISVLSFGMQFPAILQICFWIYCIENLQIVSENLSADIFFRKSNWMDFWMIVSFVTITGNSGRLSSQKGNTTKQWSAVTHWVEEERNWHLVWQLYIKVYKVITSSQLGKKLRNSNTFQSFSKGNNRENWIEMTTRQHQSGTRLQINWFQV